MEEISRVDKKDIANLYHVKTPSYTEHIWSLEKIT